MCSNKRFHKVLVENIVLDNVPAILILLFYTKNESGLFGFEIKSYNWSGSRQSGNG